MNFEIVELSNFSGNKAVFYTVQIIGEEGTLFDQFLDRNSNKYRNEVKDILGRLRLIASKTGLRYGYYKDNEGSPGDGVIALFDEPDRNLRIYCIKSSEAIIILGSGGYKPKGICAWQEDETLTIEAETMKEVSRRLTERIISREVQISPDYYQLLGNLIFSDEDEYEES